MACLVTIEPGNEVVEGSGETKNYNYALNLIIRFIF